MIHQLCASVTLCMESAHASLLLSRCSVDSFVLFRLKLCGTIRKLGLLCRGIANKNKVKAKHYWTLIAFHHKGNNQFPSEASCAGDVVRQLHLDIEWLGEGCVKPILPARMMTPVAVRISCILFLVQSI